MSGSIDMTENDGEAIVTEYVLALEAERKKSKFESAKRHVCIKASKLRTAQEEYDRSLTRYEKLAKEIPNG